MPEPEDTPENCQCIHNIIEICPKNLEHKNEQGQTLLLSTIERGDLTTVKILLSNRADIFAQDNQKNGLLQCHIQLPKITHHVPKLHSNIILHYDMVSCSVKPSKTVLK